MSDAAGASPEPEKAAAEPGIAPLGSPLKEKTDGEKHKGKDKPAKDKTNKDGGKAASGARGAILARASPFLEPLEALRAFLLDNEVKLEPGWTVEVHKRKAGIATEKMSDIYYFSPGRQKFRSKPEVLKFLTGQSLPKGERKERGAGKSAAGPKTRADLYADAKKHLARCSQLPEVDRMRVNNLGILAGSFHDADRLYPVGYCTEWHHVAFNCVFVSKILSAGDEPIFRVEARPLEKDPAPLPKLYADAKASMDSAAALFLTKPQAAAAAAAAASTAAAAPAEGARAAADGSTTPGAPAAAVGATPEKATPPPPGGAGVASAAVQWSGKGQDVKHTLVIGYSPDEAWDEMYRTFPTLAFTGEHFGLYLPEVAKLLEGLNGADQCDKYEFVANWTAEARKRKTDAKLLEFSDDKNGWSFQRIKDLEDRRKRLKDLPTEEAEKLNSELAEYEAHRKAVRERQKEQQRAVTGQAKDAAKEAKERAREQAQAAKEARAKINRYPVEDTEVLAREAEDAFVKGEPAPAHPARPEASPIGTDTGDVLSIADFFEDEFVSEKDMSTLSPLLLRMAVDTPNDSALLGDVYCALLKAALVGPDGVEEKYLDSDSPPPPVWLKYLRRDGHSVWPELLRRWVLNGPCARHYTEMELDLVRKLSNTGPGSIDGQSHLMLMRHLCDDVLLTTHARKVIDKNEGEREKLSKELREKEKKLKEVEKAHTAAKQKEKEAKDELVRAREALSNPAKESAAPSTNGGGAAEGATPPQPARRLTAAEAQVAIKVAEDKLKEQKALIKELEKQCHFTPSDTMWEDEREDVAAEIEARLRAVIVRASPIGIDRDMNRYWWFQTDSGSLYIERPPSIGPAVEMEGAGASGVGGAQPMDTTPAGASPAGATPAGETLSVAGATLAGSGPEKMDVDSPEQGAAAPPKPKEEEKEFEWGLAARLVGREESSVTSEWARYSTPEQLDELLAALFSNGIRERKLISALKGLREKIVDGMQKRDETEEKLRKNSTPKAFWFEQGYSATNPGAIRVAASEALRIAGRVQEWAPQVTPPQGFTDWVRNLREYAGGRGVIEAPANVIMDVVAGLLSFEEAMCMALESRAMKPPASRAEGRGGAPGGAEGADAAAAAGPAAGDDEQKDDCDGQGNDADGVKGPEDLFDQGLQDEAYSEWHEAYEERYRGANLVIEQRAAPHSTKSTQVWRGQYAFTIRRNWRQALSRAATNESAAQLAYCVVAFSERMQHQLAALERQGKKAAKLRGDDGRAPSGRPSRAKRARTETAGEQQQQHSSDSDSG